MDVAAGMRDLLEHGLEEHVQARSRVDELAEFLQDWMERRCLDVLVCALGEA